MGLTQSAPRFQGQIDIQLHGDYSNGLMQGKVTYKSPFVTANLIFVVLHAQESIKGQKATGQKTIVKELIKSVIFSDRVGAFKNIREFQFKTQQSIPMNFYSHSGRVAKGLTVQSTIYIEAYLTNGKQLKTQSSQVLPNSRKVLFMKMPRLNQQSKPINKIYDPKLLQFEPVIEIYFPKNIFRIGELLQGTISIDNRKAGFQINSNSFNIVQIVEIQGKNGKNAQFSKNIMNTQSLDTLHNETKVINIEYKFGQSFKDALSYSGQIYTIQYYLELFIVWDNGQEFNMTENIQIIEELQ